MPFTRRTMLAASAGAGLSGLAADSGQTLRLPRKVRLALTGFDGHVAEIVDPLPGLPDVEFVAVHGTPQEQARLRSKSRAADARRYDELGAMLDREKPDVVGICNHNGARAAAILECARRGIHVVAEKPLAITREDYVRVKEAVQKSGIQLSMLLPMRFEPPFATLRKIVTDGAIGEVIQVAGQKSYKQDDSAWKRNRATYGSTILWIGIHMIDLMRWASGREMVDAAGWQARVGFPQLKDQEDVSASVFQLDNGGLAILRMDYLRPRTAPTHGDDRLRLAGTKGVAEYTAATGVTLITEGSKPTTVPLVPAGGSVLADFLSAVYAGGTRLVTEDDIWRVNEITLAAHESATQKAKVLRI